MTPLETVDLTEFVAALAPQQRFNEYTPDAWHLVLGKYPLEDCQRAAVAIAERQAFIAPADIVAELRRIRGARLENFRYEPADPDETPVAYLANRRRQLRAAADGPVVIRGEIESRRGPDTDAITELLPGVTKTVDGPDDAA